MTRGLPLSIIIPVLNEAAIARESLGRLPYGDGMEVLIIDGGSQDKTIDICRQFTVQVFRSPRGGRAQQMNFGAQQATGDILLFLHLDSWLPPDFFAQITQTLTAPSVIAGAFQLTIALPGWPYRWLEKTILWRSHLGQLPYGDQGLFLYRKHFQHLGGFADLPLMEDYELVQRLKPLGRVAIARASVITSGRRWQKLGLLQTTLINQAIVLGYHLGISPHTLARWYHRLP
ncbi:MAG: TIGR04283 family arsenosugar biosynthesis glycosyltransferase [Synechocystis sp.]